jgi:dTDP-4-dehydrorhamnose reductase
MWMPARLICNPDQKGTPTYALDLANAIITILDKVKAVQSKDEYVGVYHFSNEGVCSWYDFTQMIARRSNTIPGGPIPHNHGEDF